jgi:hypothetical protein
MAKKRIKTFTVDTETYDALVAMFREHEAEVSVSYYVDRCLKDLLKYLSTLDDLRRKEPDKHSVPMSYVIDTIAREPKMSIIELEDSAAGPYVVGTDELEEIQIRYEAERKRIPLRFWRLLRTGAFKISNDGKHVINKKTGYAYTPTEWGLPESAPELDEEIGG